MDSTPAPESPSLDRANDLKWAHRAKIGVGLVLLAFLLVPVCTSMQSMLGQWFGGATLAVEFLTALAGSLTVAVSVANTSHRKTWQGMATIAWGALGVVSPLFGWVFLLPWGLMLLTSPAIVWFVRGWLRA